MISHIAVVLSWFSSFTWTKTLTLTLIKTLTPMLKKNSTIYTRTSKRNVLMMQYSVSGTRRRQLLESWETYKSTRGNANDWLYPNYIHVIKKVVCCVGSIEIRAECVGRLKGVKRFSLTKRWTSAFCECFGSTWCINLATFSNRIHSWDLWHAAALNQSNASGLPSIVNSSL